MDAVSAILCFLWGAAATYCFFIAWFAAIGVMICGVGLWRRKASPGIVWQLVYGQLTTGLAHGLGLALTFAICWHRLHLGRQPIETLFFLLAAILVMATMLPTVRHRIDVIWDTAVDPDKQDP